MDEDKRQGINDRPAWFQRVYAARYLIIGFLITMLAFTAFRLGIVYACAGGYTVAGKCATPQVIGVYKVCEYNGQGCLKACATIQLPNPEKVNLTLYPAGSEYDNTIAPVSTEA